MYAVIHKDCTGCGLCEQLCPAVFTVQKGTARASIGDIEEPAIPAAAAARDSCPLAAIDLLNE